MPVKQGRIKQLKYWLLAIWTVLITLHLNLTFQSANTDLLSSAFLFWLAVTSLIWKKHNTLQLNSDAISSLIGALLIILLLNKSMNSSYDHFLRIYPLISIFSLGLLASGFRDLKHYRQEVLIFSFFAVPPGLLSLFIDLSGLTAKFAVFVLGLLGFRVVSQGVNVILPTGFIEVYHGCSGMSSILQLLGLSLIILSIFPTNSSQKIWLVLMAIVIGFVINGLRVALMAVLVAAYNQSAFKYWHVGDGSLIFSTSAVLIFVILSQLLLQKTSKSYKQV